MEEIIYQSIGNNYIKFQELLKDNKHKRIKLILKTKFNRDKDFSSYQYIFKTLEVNGVIINSTPYHLLLKLNDFKFRSIRYLDIEKYCIIT